MRLTFAFLCAVAGLSAAAATVYNWDGGAGTAHLNDAENWSADILPDTATIIEASISITENAKDFDLTNDFAPYMLSVKQTGDYQGRSVIDLNGFSLAATNSKDSSGKTIGSTAANFKPAAKDLWILNGSLDFYKLHHQANSCTTYSNVTLKARNNSGSYFAYQGAKIVFFDSTYTSDSAELVLRTTSPGASIEVDGVCAISKALSCSGTNQTVVIRPNAVCTGDFYLQNGSFNCAVVIGTNATASLSHLRTTSGTSAKGSISPTVTVEPGAKLNISNWAGTYSFVNQNGRVVVNNGTVNSSTQIDFGYVTVAKGCGIEFNGDNAKVRANGGSPINFGNTANAQPCWLSFNPGPTGFGGAAPLANAGTAKDVAIADNVVISVDARAFLKGKTATAAKPTVRLPLVTATGTLNADADALAPSARFVPAGGWLVKDGKTLYAEFPLRPPATLLSVR